MNKSAVVDITYGENGKRRKLERWVYVKRRR